MELAILIFFISIFAGIAFFAAVIIIAIRKRKWTADETLIVGLFDNRHIRGFRVRDAPRAGKGNSLGL